MPFDVYTISNTMRGAPVVNNTAASIIAALDALLSTGWAITTASSITVSGGVATVSLPSGQSFEKHAIVRVLGSTLPGVDGDARVLSATASSITFAATAADGSYSGGGMTVRYAPHPSWERAFSGTELAAYRSIHAASSGFCYRVADPAGLVISVRGYESMTDVDTGVAPFPSLVMQGGNGVFFPKTNANNATAIPYVIAADHRAVVINIAPAVSSNAAYGSYFPHGFGAAIALAPGGDPWAEFVAGAVNATVNGYANGNHRGSLIENAFHDTYLAGGMQALARPPTGLGGAVQTATRSYIGNPSTSSGGVSGNDPVLGSAPAAIDGKLVFSRMFFRMAAAGNVEPRALVPGVYYCPQTQALAAVGAMSTVEGTGELAGHRLLCLPTYRPYNGPSGGVPEGAYFLDLTSWR